MGIRTGRGWGGEDLTLNRRTYLCDKKGRVKDKYRLE